LPNILFFITIITLSCFLIAKVKGYHGKSHIPFTDKTNVFTVYGR
jgi:hypothetical protein